jgi:SprT protein
MAEIQRNALTQEQILQAIGEPPSGIKDEIESIVNEALSLLEDIYDITVKRPEIVYDLKGTTAGRARGYRDENGNKQYAIRVNNDLLYGTHKDEMLQQTIPHEAAHIFVYQAWPGSKGHGREWQAVMHQLGLEPTRCHQYETTKARNRERMPRPYIYVCACDGVEHKMTQITHNRMLDGTKYTCRRCGETLEFVWDETED